jgi:hypothetical protein
VRHLGRLRHRGERGERGRAGEPGETAAAQSLGRLGRQPRLAHAARPGERDQALGGELLQHAGHIEIPADEAGRLTPAAAAGPGAGALGVRPVVVPRRLGHPGRGCRPAVPGYLTSCSGGRLGTGRRVTAGIGGDTRPGGNRDLLTQDRDVSLVKLRGRVHAEVLRQLVAGSLVDG